MLERGTTMSRGKQILSLALKIVSDSDNADSHRTNNTRTVKEYENVDPLPYDHQTYNTSDCKLDDTNNEFEEDDDDSVKDSDFHPSGDDSESTEGETENVPLPRQNKNISDIRNSLTKKGTNRKRKRYETPLKERKQLKLEKIVSLHKVQQNCTDTCKKKCSRNITTARQADINKQYWSMSQMERKTFMLHNTKKEEVKRRTTHVTAEGSRRNNSLKYFLDDENRLKHAVCKKFFLATLGYQLKNDRILRNVTNTETSSITPKLDNRGKRAKENKFDENVIVNHIETFRPIISHYRREHAPLRRYLPGDITIRKMFEDFKLKYSVNISYELYRRVVAKQNISFAILGNEECSVCETFVLHEKSTDHGKESLVDDCSECQSWKNHHEKYKTARQEYKADAEKEDGLYFSADLQKVI